VTLATIAPPSFGLWNVLLLAIVLGGASFAIQARTGINLADEGFLWYGVQQTVRGKVPLRDFQSYEPGRYYWSAAGMILFGKGLVALRLSETLFQILGLWVGLLAATRIAHSWGLLISVGAMLTLWMVPSHKLFDHVLLLFGIWLACRVVEDSSPARIFTAGFFIGLCFVFGRNHALYNFLAQACLLVFLSLKLPFPLSISQIGLWFGGILLGLVPTIMMFICMSGFFTSYIEPIRMISRQGANLSLPIPWPWRVMPNSPTDVMQFLLGILLIALPMGYLAAIVASLVMRPQAVQNHSLLIGCAFMGVFYLHHAFSRPDFSHLAQVIHPFTLGVLALLSFFDTRQLYYWIVTVLLIANGAFTVGRQMPLYQRLTSRIPWVPCDAGGKIFVAPSTARLVACLRRFSIETMGSRDGVIMAPFMPALYSIMNRESPLWQLSFLFPATAEDQQAMIRDLNVRNVNWAIISDVPMDKREDRRFSATHRVLWQYLIENFEPVENDCLPKVMKMLHRKHPGQAVRDQHAQPIYFHGSN
jgi:hypothetical protein